MLLKQMRYFVTVVEHKSFSKAAESLFVSQSTLSQSIRALEDELGFILLERSRKGVTLTEIGNIVYSDVKETLSSIEKQKNDWQELYNKEFKIKGTVRIVTVPGCYPLLANYFSRKLSGSYPNIDYSIIEARNFITFPYLIDDQVDLVVSDFIDNEEDKVFQLAEENDLQVVKLRKDSYKIAIRKQNPLSGKEHLSSADAQILPLACYSGGDAAAALYFEKYFNPSLRVEFNSIEKMIRAAIEGRAVSVLPELTIKNSLSLYSYNKDALKFLTVEGFSVAFTHYLCFRKNKKQTAELNVVRNMIESLFMEL